MWCRSLTCCLFVQYDQGSALDHVFTAHVCPLQVLTHGGTAPWASSCRYLNWPWYALLWRTMITRPKMTLWDNSLYLSQAYAQVLIETQCVSLKSHHSCRLWVMSVLRSSLFSGYRHVHLLKADGSSLSPATLFIHVKVSRKGIPIKSVSERMAMAKAKAWRASEWDGKLHI